MAKALSIASWNVKHFGRGNPNGAYDRARVERCIDFLAAQNADVVAVYEVASKRVFRPMVAKMPQYTFHITEGSQAQEILVGVRSRLSAYVTQRLEFKSGQSTLRPGVLVTVNRAGAFYPVLFLHLKSFPDPKGFGLRHDMLDRALAFRKTLDRVEGGAGRANYIFLGDLNTMGFDYTRAEHDIPASREIAELARRAGFKRNRMCLAEKSESTTWWKHSSARIGPSDLDHVVAAEHLQFRQFRGADVDVRGWPQESTPRRKDLWVERFSDHALLFLSVEKV